MCRRPRPALAFSRYWLRAVLRRHRVRLRRRGVPGLALALSIRPVGRRRGRGDHRRIVVGLDARQFAHDRFILLTPLLFKLLQLGLAPTRVETGSEMPGLAARLADPFAEEANRLQQAPGTRDD